MPDRRRPPRLDHPIIITFLILAIIGFMALAAEVLKPLALSILFSFALAPIASFFERRGLPRTAAVVLTILLTLGVLAGITYKVGQQLTLLANDLPRYTENIEKKLTWLKHGEDNTLDRLSKMGQEVARTLDKPPQKNIPGVQPVSIVAEPSITNKLQSAVGPYLESLGVVSFVLILVLFMLNNREDLTDRVIRLCGQGRVSLTTRTMDEVGQRISRYLGMFTLVNSSFGLIVGLGLWAIGVPYAVLWAVMFALLRFIPYVGPAAAFALPLIFSFAYFPTWKQPLMVVALFGTLETVANSFLEPVLYGRTTGVSALGLLVAAMFWTWLWGALGLFLSTPLTVCLAVLGKYVPGLGVFATMLGEEPALEPDVRFYQRLLAVDQDGATTIIDAALKQQPREQVFDQILVPALSRAERDRARDDIGDSEQAFIWRVIGDVIDDLAETPAIDLKTLAASSGATPPDGERPELSTTPPPTRIMGIAASDHADELVLRMLAQLVPPDACTLTVVATYESPLKLAEQVAGSHPDLVLLSHLPPAGFTSARYLVRRVRARNPEVPIVVGRWRETGDPVAASEQLTAAGATRVVFQLAEARDLILEKYAARPEAATAEPVAAAASVP
jgi:predicted PurR-regulated permease PerM